MSCAPTNTSWRIWDGERSYGETLFKRATGELPEMESSKKLASEVARVLRTGDSILDVGCGSGHYLRSLRRVLAHDVTYTGVDATEYYIQLARKAFATDEHCEFKVADIYDLDLPDRSFDIVMCNNVLLHLPSIESPLSELVRVARRTVFVRLLCGNRSFRIQDVESQPDGCEFENDGTPRGFHYYNIYSEEYVGHLLSKLAGVETWSLTPDTDFDKRKILTSTGDHQGARDATTIVGDYQVNGYILQPWQVLEITLSQD